MFKKLNPYAKALIAAVVSGYAMFEFAAEPIIIDGNVVEAAGVITQVEWYRITGAVVAALGLVWGVPNTVVEKVSSYREKVSAPALSIDGEPV